MSTLRELAAKHGIDLNQIKDQDEFIDMETGKRIAVDHPREMCIEINQREGAEA